MRTFGKSTWLTLACGSLLTTAAWSQDEIPPDQLKPVPGPFGGAIVVPQQPQFDALQGFDYEANALEIQIVGKDGNVQGDHAIPLGDYWIGVASQEADAALRAQLELADGVGLVVMRVIDDSPAKKAGLMEQDVLVKAGDTQLKSLTDLVAAVQAAGEKDLALRFYRKGKAQDLTVTPRKRLVESTARTTPPAEAAHGIRMRLPHYIIVAAPQEPLDLKISIQRKKNQKANIVVERDNVKYQVVEGHTEDLPPDLRAVVTSLLTAPRFRVATTKPVPTAPQAPSYGFTHPVTPPGTPVTPSVRWGVAATPAGNLEAQMKELSAQMYKLMKLFEHHHRLQAAQAAPEAELKKTKPAPLSPTEQLRQEVEALRKEVEVLKKQKQ